MPTPSSPAIRLARTSIALVAMVAVIAATARAQSPADPRGAGSAPAAGQRVIDQRSNRSAASAQLITGTTLR
jgi:hypothetical protein